MTLAETLAGLYWLQTIAATDGTGGVYATAAVIAGAGLWIGLTVEGVIESLSSGKGCDTRSVAYALIEVFAWTQWAIIATAGLWSRTGVGPATVVLAALLTAVHAMEGAGRGESLRIRHGINGLIEALAVSTAWVLLDTSVLAAGVGLFVLLGVEHAHRLTNL